MGLPLVALLTVASAWAVPPGKQIEFAGGAMGRVVFDGAVHSDAGRWCSNCHTKIFSINPVERVRITPDDHRPGRLCGVCHDGADSFGMKDKKTCGRCHRKDPPAGPPAKGHKK